MSIKTSGKGLRFRFKFIGCSAFAGTTYISDVDGGSRVIAVEHVLQARWIIYLF